MSGTSVTITAVTSGQMPPPSATPFHNNNNDSPVTITPVFTSITSVNSASTNSSTSSSSVNNDMKNSTNSSNNTTTTITPSDDVGGGKDSSNVVVLNKQRLQELVNEIDPREQLDEEVEDLLLNIADDFVDNVVTNACKLAKHRGSKTLEVKDVQLTLEKDWNLFIPGFGSLPLANEFKQLYKKSPAIEAHKQRLALIKKTLKKL
ncbi:transcription initiation factor TFIID subunit 12-like [Panonychus citri]|uniref:transcription initiation factor TFIID subunit 12-like n=1 Tax=Panonychus citri TaxID=50023 RepID=UPI002307D50E|nr:transcription initiation factor TFIID subunit 12-like [Panonychus citri]